MPETRSDGIRISYDDAGDGEPALLVLPGWCDDRAGYAELARRCAARRRVLALDWRGHGPSGPSPGDFGAAELVRDARAVIEASGVRAVVPAAQAHAGWIAIELRRQLGERVPKLVLMEWLVLDPPPPFLEALQALRQAERWARARDELFGMWLHGVQQPAVVAHVRGRMGGHGFDMWARAAREIAGAYARAGSPLQALAGLDPPVATQHLYAQPDAPEFLAAQHAFAGTHPWFHVHKLAARSHFPAFEVPGEMADVIERFVAERPASEG